MVLVAIFIISGLILVNAVYVAAEFSAVSVRASRVHMLAGNGNRLAKKLLPILNSPVALDQHIAACQIGITLSSLVIGAYAQATFAVWLMPFFASWTNIQIVAAESLSAGFVLIILAGLQLLLGELIPKSLALQYPTPMALYTMLPMAPSALLFKPFNTILNGSSLGLLRLLGASTHGHRHIHSPEEIELLIADSREGGLLKPDEHRRLQRALRLNLWQARQLMVPRTRLKAIDVNTPLDQAVTIVTQGAYSQLPVYRDSIDNIVGILHAKDLARWCVTNNTAVPLVDVIHPLSSLHESVTADRVLRHFREQGVQQALVVDEFGGTAGLVTLKDVLSELLGDTGDELQSNDPAAEILPNGRIRLPGRMPVHKAARLLNVKWETEVATLGGLVTAELERLPEGGEQVVLGNVELTVEQVAEHAVQFIIARRLNIIKAQTTTNA